jgi:hypothetical protein
MNPGDLIYLKDNESNLTPALFISESPDRLTGLHPKVTVLHQGVIEHVARWRVRTESEAIQLIDPCNGLPTVL